MALELFYFRWSHYNEKARWALEYKGLPYARRTLLPGRHMGLARRLTGATLVPILVMDGIAIGDSTRIIAALERAFPERPLYPRDAALRARVLELEDFFDEQLGPHLRRIVIAACLPHTVYMAHLFDSDAPWWQRGLYRAVLHRAKAQFAERMQTDAASVAQSWNRVDAALARLERELQPSGYLAGDAFSVADLTAAALLSVGVLPPGFPCLPTRPLPPSVQEVHDRLAVRRAFHWAHGIYARHRAAAPRAASEHEAPFAAAGREAAHT